MPSPELDDALATVRAFCESRVPTEYQDETRIECDRRGNSITIVERRPPWKPELVGSEWSSLKVAQLRYEPKTARWSLCYRDRNERWWLYDGIGSTTSVDPLLAEVDADPTGIFWG
jgi:hypothetical protein